MSCYCWGPLLFDARVDGCLAAALWARDWGAVCLKLRPAMGSVISGATVQTSLGDMRIGDG